jgi:hypothetical protein
MKSFHLGFLLSINISLFTTIAAMPSKGTAAPGPTPLPAAGAPIKDGKSSDGKPVEVVKNKTSCKETEEAVSFETVPIFYSKPSTITEQLNLLDKPAGSYCGEVMGVDSGSPNSIMIYGSLAGRDRIKRYIGNFDLPRERVHMDLWAIQISSANKAQLSDVMDQVKRQVDQTSEAMQLTFKEFSELSSMTVLSPDQEREFRALGFGNLFQDDPRLSLIQMLLRNAMAEDPLKNYDSAAIKICSFFAGNSNAMRFRLYNNHEGRTLKTYNNQRIFNTDPKRAYRRPFQGFMSLALHQQFDDTSLTPKCGDGIIGMSFEEARALKHDALGSDPKNKKMHALRVALGLERRRNALKRFARSYQNYRISPSTNYNPAELAENASIVDGMISPIVDAINRDVESYFIQPTLLKIREIVARNRGVEYAEVGRTTIAGINGNEVTVKSGTTSTFDEVTPLRLSDWLKNAQAEQTNVNAMLPNLVGVNLGGADSQSLLGKLPAPQAVALLSALSKQEVSWQALTSGITLKLTPIVMRNQAQATVNVDLSTAYPAFESADKKTDSATNPTSSATNPTSTEVKLRSLSRISQSKVDTKVYVNTWDLFALSSFNNQTTITGRRWYVPLVGTIWEGAFGDIPVLGEWFSFKRPPQNVQHQSIILANTLIVPSAMGMASFYSGEFYPDDPQYRHSPYRSYR